MSDLCIIKLTDLDSIFALSDTLLKNIYTHEELSIKNNKNFNPDYLQFVIFVLKGDLPLARLAIYENGQIRVALNNALVIGNFESVNDKQVVDLIFGEAEKYAKENNYASLVGPINGSTWDNYRLPVESNYPLFFTEEIYKNYYSDLFCISGFELLTEYYSTGISDLASIVHEPIHPRQTFFLNSGIQVRSISKEKLEGDLELIYHFSMQKFSKNYLFSSIPKSYFIAKYLPLKQYIDPNYCLMAFDVNNDLVAFIFCIPDLLNKDSNTLIVKTVAGKDGRNYAGITTWLFRQIVAKAIQNGYTYIINAFMHKNNVSINISRKYKSEIIRTYHLYIKKFNA